LNKVNKYGDTPINITVRNGETDVFSFLTERGFNINILNTKNDTDLHLRPDSNCVNIMKIVSGKQTSVNFTKRDDIFPYMLQLKLAICMQGNLLSKEFLL